MNTIKRLILGSLSSILLAIGFARAADYLDPITQSLHATSNGLAPRPAQNCTTPCNNI